jgi:hypothetical protein
VAAVAVVEAVGRTTTTLALAMNMLEVAVVAVALHSASVVLKAQAQAYKLLLVDSVTLKILVLAVLAALMMKVHRLVTETQKVAMAELVAQ